MKVQKLFEKFTEAFIADLGSDHDVFQDGKKVMTLGRYGVYAKSDITGKHEVIDVGSDPDELRRKHRDILVSDDIFNLKMKGR